MPSVAQKIAVSQADTLPRRTLLAARTLASWGPVLWGLTLAVSGCTKPKPVAAPTQAAEAVLSAEVMTVSLMPWPEVVRSQGNLIPDEVAVVGAKVAGRIAETPVDIGQLVKTGDVLMRLDRVEFEMQLSQAEAQLLQARSAVGLKPDDPIEKLNPLNAPPVREAQAVLDEARTRRERWKQLRQENAAATEEYEQAVSLERVADARLASALNGVYEKIALIKVRMAELDLAKDRLNETVVVAPFDGEVQMRHVGQGAYVNIGQPLVTVVRTDPLRFQGMVPERAAQALAVGQDLVLSIESIREPRKVQVTRISPTLESRSRSLMFEAVISNTDRQLRGGLFAEAEVVLDDTAQAIVIPRTALVEFAGSEKVWKVLDGKCKEQMVVTARRNDDWIEIAKGLAAGDRILVDGRAGRPAKIEPIENRMELGKGPDSPSTQPPLTSAETKPAAGQVTPTGAGS